MTHELTDETAAIVIDNGYDGHIRKLIVYANSIHSVPECAKLALLAMMLPALFFVSHLFPLSWILVHVKS